MRQKAVLGIDLGGTKISGAIFNHSSNIVQSEQMLINGMEGNEVATLLVRLIERLQVAAERMSLSINAVGIAIPGIFNALEGTVWAPNIKGWEKFPLPAQLRKRFGDAFHIEIDNDRSCYILGETWMGAAKGSKNAIFLAVGTGIGAGIMVDGQVLRGQSGIAGAVGWLALSDKFIEPYGQYGCFEHHASGHGMARIAAKAYRKAGKAESFEKLTAEDVFEFYSKGDPVAINVIEEAIRYWGRTTANLVSLFNPEKIIFGGGVFGPATGFLGEIYQEALKWAQPVSITQVQLVSSALEGRAGLYGAGWLVKDHLTTEA